MLSKYFKFKVETQQFYEDINEIFEKTKNKKILLCVQSKDEFVFLNKKYNIFEKLNIVNLSLFKTKEKFDSVAKNVNIIDFENIKNTDFDIILVLSSNATNIINKIKFNLMVENCEIYTPFIEYVEDEKKNISYLLSFNFDKTLPNLLKKIKNKKVVIYGAGVLFELIHKYFDLSELKPIGITDLKFKDVTGERYFWGYKMIHPNDIYSLNPDYVLVTTKIFIQRWETLYYDYFEKTKTKIIPIVEKNFIQTLKDIANS